MTSTNYLAHEAKDYSYLNVIQSLLWAIFFLPFCLLGGLQLIIPSGTTPDWWQAFVLPVWLWVFCISFLFFTNAILYVLISLIAVTSGLAAFMWGHKALPLRILALLGALSVIALPWLLPYKPALEPAPGVTMQVVTQPLSPIESFVKMAYLFSEEVPCEYNLLGWSTDNQLYYRSECGAEEQIWHVDPRQPDKPIAKTDLPNDLTAKSSQKEQEALRQELLEMVHTGGVRPESAERSVREIYLRDGSLSPDGQWIAAITQYLYAPQDVVLLRKAK